MAPMRSFALLALLAPSLLAVACSSSSPPGDTGSPTSSGGGASPPGCAVEGKSFEAGDPDGHPDPTGAKAAGQARAGRIEDASAIAQPAHGRQRIEDGDFLLANDRIAVVIEDKGTSDGY